MRHMKTISVPATTKEVVGRTSCDFCGATISSKTYDFTEVTISCEVGTRYPEGGSSTKTMFDCCPSCWGRVESALRGMGATPRTERKEW